MTDKLHIIEEPRQASRVRRKSAMEAVFSSSSISATVMVAAAILSILVANTALYDLMHEFLETPLVISIGSFHASMNFEQFVNDFLMAIFFLLVGVELKYEVTVGELRHPKKAALPMLAAVGGVCVPALIFLFFNQGATANGWAVPIATDIAFALGVMSLMGSRVSSQTKVFFQTLAIADDILAVIVLALFYGQALNIVWCLLSLLVILLLFSMNRMRIFSVRPYVIVGLILWFCMFKSGIHATLAGVILAFFLPAKSDVRLSYLHNWLDARSNELDDVYDDETHILGQTSFTDLAYKVEEIMHHVTPPLERMGRSISTLTNFVILPLFAFVNAQVHVVDTNFAAIFADPVWRGVFFGAVVGKPIGIILVTILMAKLHVGKLSENVSKKQLIAVGLMGGMGFTMSILITGLAFTSPIDQMAAKIAILMASVTSGLLGTIFLAIFEKKQDTDELEEGLV